MTKAKKVISKERRKQIDRLAQDIKNWRMRSRLGDAQLGYFERMLMSQKTTILQEIEKLDKLRKSEVEASGGKYVADNHTSDPSATDTQISNRQKRLKKISDALARIENNTYGICIGKDCGQPIDIKRLELTPITDLCAPCKEEKEKKEKKINGNSRHHQTNLPMCAPAQ
ncbi:MAG: TraR/DksA C4-type zinc finger protein [Candidatus Portnoybacteria bacterium]|nr:TraR/DksA C4-type zinc finger protein [Candidatus Portnoybacteria bacterium]MDD4982831.1 TraR/DksA C4-type zinc finger protein [Candidatus Portnoybacteria bacterium]